MDFLGFCIFIFSHFNLSHLSYHLRKHVCYLIVIFDLLSIYRKHFVTIGMNVLLYYIVFIIVYVAKIERVTIDKKVNIFI